MRTRGMIVILLPIILGVFLIFQPIYVSSLVGSSMEPTVGDGSILVYSDYASPDIGDIIVYETKSNIRVSHRVVGIENGSLITKGDNNIHVDPYTVKKDDIEGTVLFWTNPQQTVYPTAWLPAV